MVNASKATNYPLYCQECIRLCKPNMYRCYAQLLSQRGSLRHKPEFKRFLRSLVFASHQGPVNLCFSVSVALPLQIRWREKATKEIFLTSTCRP